MPRFKNVADVPAVLRQDVGIKGKPFEFWAFGPRFWIPISNVFFAVSVERLGLFIVAGLVLLSCPGCSTTLPLEALALAPGTAALRGCDRCLVSRIPNPANGSGVLQTPVILHGASYVLQS